MEIFKYDKERVKIINKFMQELLSARDTNEKVALYRKYEKEIENLNPLDIFYLDFYSDNSPLSIAEIKESANKFVNVFHKGIDNYSELGDHLLFKELLSESKRIQDHLSKIKAYYKRDKIIENKDILLDVFEKCNDFEQKFIKFQNIIFPNLEGKVPSNKPLEVLWELHDDSKALLKEIIELLNQENNDEEKLIKTIGAYHYLVFGINQKEELILLPVMKQLLTVEELNKVYNECLEIGFFKQDKPQKILPKTLEKVSGYFISKTGKLSLFELEVMLNNLPFDITFVDKNDTVLYYNDNPNRHFPRSPSVIGRQVKNCHPPKSVHIVEGIIADLKSGKKDSEEFWLDFKDKKIYISYYAVRDEENNYLGTLEVSQDITRFLSISKEKRLRDD
jgi:DUF438 domain-containing protein